MASIRDEIVYNLLNNIYALTDFNIYNNVDEIYAFRKQSVLANKSLTKDEKSEAIRLLNKYHDRDKLIYNEGTKRICEDCQLECLATLFCENCVQNYLKANFSNRTSKNDEIDNLIHKCQMEILGPDLIVEWISYNNLQNINYFTKGGCSEIYTADWIDRAYSEWDSKEKQLKRTVPRKVILKMLKNVEKANRSWFDEVCN